MLLTQLVDNYVDSRNEERPIGRELTKNSVQHLRECVASYSRHLERPATVEDFSATIINAFLAALLVSGLSPYSVKNRRTGLRALWRFAKNEGLTTADPNRMRRVYCPRLEPKGYTSAEMLRLLVAAAQLSGTVRGTGVSKRVYFTSMLLTMWNIGCRIGDIPRIETMRFDSRGRLWVLESKTGKSRWHHLHAITAEAIGACIDAAPGRKHIWPGHKVKNLYGTVRSIAEAASLPGTSRWIRRGSSSELDRLQPGMGWRFLNHSRPDVFDKHYRVDEICGDESLSPPALQVDASIAALYRPQFVQAANREQLVIERSKRAAKFPSDVILSGEAREALGRATIGEPELEILAVCLASQGITQRELAEWWGYKFKFYQNMRYGYKAVPEDAAHRLREVFGVRCAEIAAPPRPSTIQPQSLPATQAILTLLRSGKLGAFELRTVLDYLRFELDVKSRTVAAAIGVTSERLTDMAKGRRPVPERIVVGLRNLFSEQAFAA